MGGLIYRALFDRILTRLDPERTHALARWLMRALAAIPGLRALLDRALRPREGLRVEALGLELRSPLGLAAGVDKDGGWFAPLGALGFGFVEVGTATAEPQPGNPRAPRRLTRLPADRALLNRMGFPNPGAAAIARRLRRRPPGLVVGANVGRTKAAPEGETLADYRRSVRELAPVADFLVVNVSSPNTPGLRDLQSVERLGELVDAVRAELATLPAPPPLLVKIAPDLADAEIEAIADLALERGLDGIVAVNTSVDHGLAAAGAAEIAAAGHGGGLSGRPLRERAVAVLELLRARVGDRLTLVSVGGIETPEDAWERILAGATLVQAYTALVYGGPLWPSRLNRGLAGLLRESPWETLEEAVGKGAA